MPSNYNDPQNKRELADRNKFIEEDIHHQQEQIAENNGTTKGLLVGGIVTALLGIGTASAYYYLNPTPTTIINNVPVNPATAVSPASPQVKIIEIEKPVVVPVSPAPAPPATEVPKSIVVPPVTKIIAVPTSLAPSLEQNLDTPRTERAPATQPPSAASGSSEPNNSALPSSLDRGNN